MRIGAKPLSAALAPRRAVVNLPRARAPARFDPPRWDRFGLLCAVLAAAGFSGKAILVKLAYRYGVDAETLLALRLAFGLPFFLVLGGIRAHRTLPG